MSYTSTAGAWIETPGLDVLTAADKPLTTMRARLLNNNLQHLRDTSTQERVSIVAMTGDDITGGDAGSFTRSSPVVSITTPWSVLSPAKLARPVLRVGASVASGTGYVSAALYPTGTRHSADGRSALAFWESSGFTNTTPAIVIEDAAAITWSKSRASVAPWNRPPPADDGFRAYPGSDPKSDGTYEPSKAWVVTLDLVIWVRAAEVDIQLIQLREFSGP